ncbi:MAG: SRPBCC domain-containing protein [Acidobacteria bacterium]|nr:SRPBCC domain-containing protein [Acidobacteriota bacterium]
MKTRPEKVDFKTLVRVAPERVFDALTTARGLDEWFTASSSIDPTPGGLIVYRWKDWGIQKYTGEYRGQVIEIDRPRRYVWQWMADSGGYDTTVEMDFTPTGEGTLVRLVEYGYEDGPVGMRDLLNRVAGWAEVLTLMKYYLEHGVRY